MHVQTIPKSPPKIIVQVAKQKLWLFFCAPSRATSESDTKWTKKFQDSESSSEWRNFLCELVCVCWDEHASTEMLNFRCKCERWRWQRELIFEDSESSSEWQKSCDPVCCAYCKEHSMKQSQTLARWSVSEPEMWEFPLIQIILHEKRTLVRVLFYFKISLQLNCFLNFSCS